MAALNYKLVLMLAFSAFMLSSTATARELAVVFDKPGQNLATRLDGEGGKGGGYVECWDALLELRSCTNEIIVFFMDRDQAYLGVECCKAIRIITRQCWPSMLTSIGFTSEEGDILRGYCDASSSVAPSPAIISFPPVQSPVLSPFLGPNPPVVVG